MFMYLAATISLFGTTAQNISFVKHQFQLEADEFASEYEVIQCC